MADIHLGNRAYNLVERENDVYEAFDEAVEKICKEGVKVLVIAGDLFDSSRPTVKALIKFKEAMHRLSMANVKILYVLGDHDNPKRFNELPPSMLFDKVVHIGLKNFALNLEGVEAVFTGVDRIPSYLREQALGEINALSADAVNLGKKRIMVAHVPLQSPIGISLKDLPPGYSYYALGHEHIRERLPLHDAIASYPGSLEILSRSEVETWEKKGKGFYLVDISSDEPMIHEINLESVRPQKAVELNAEDLDTGLDGIRSWSADMLRKHGKKPLIHLTIAGRALNRSKIVESTRQRLGEHVLLLRHDFKEIGAGDMAVDFRGLDLRSTIIEYMTKRGLSKEEVELAMKIYDAYREGGIDKVSDLINKHISSLMVDV
jgi:DNA repair exonuclease SbcCD nuclease subunit